MIDLKLRFFDAVMTLVRRREETYLNYSLNPGLAEGKGGLFGLATGLVNQPTNALAAPPSPYPSDYLKTDQKEMLEIVEHFAGQLELEGVIDRIRVFRDALGMMPSYKICHEEWKALRTQMETELNRRSVIYLGKTKSAPVSTMATQWATIFAAFPSVQKDVECGVQCFALEQNTASVFHMMRVAEHGLRAVAKERKMRLPKDRPIDSAEWGMLTDRLNTVINTVSNWAVKKAGRTAALQFYTRVRADTVYFKDGYRNVVSHSLSHFSEPEADSVMRRVREFMSVVSAHLSDDVKPIRWGK